MADAASATIGHAALQQAAILQEVRALREENRTLQEQNREILERLAQIQDRLDMPLPAPAAPEQSSQPVRRLAMKKPSAAAVRDPFFATALRRAHPMYVIKISTLLAPSFQHFRPHEELKASGMLTEWREGMGPVIFCSHTWLRKAHPDSEAGEKFSLLVGLLRRIRAGRLDIFAEVAASMQLPGASKKLRLRAAGLQRSLEDGYVFFDFMSIPQRDPEAQQRAVISLGSYVSASSYFFVLAGPWRHENGSLRDDVAWCRRGWCRMELAANALSPNPKPMVLAKNVTYVEANPPGGQLGRDILTYAFVGRGDFSVESDRAKLGAHLLDIINARKALALADKDMKFYRMLHSCTSHLLQGTGLEPAPEPLDTWMASMKFSSVRDGRADGLTPLFYAVIGGHLNHVQALLAQGAEIDRTTQVNDPEKTIAKGLTPLAYSCWFGRSRDGSAEGVEADRAMVAELIRNGADPRKKMLAFKFTSMDIALIAGNIGAAEALMDHDPTIIQARDNLVGAPGYASLFNSPNGRMFFDRVLARYPEELPRWLQEYEIGPNGVSRIADTCQPTGSHPDNLLAALELGLPVNAGESKLPKPFIIKILCTVADLSVRFVKTRAGTVSSAMAYTTRCTALHLASYVGLLFHVETLLEHGAHVNSTVHAWGMTPLHLATIGGHETICARLLDAGAQVGHKDKRGRTSVDWARRLGYEHIEQMLRSRQVQSSAAEPGVERGRSAGRQIV